MRNIVLLLLFCITLLSAEVNECKSDVYFANGIDTTKEQAYYAKDKLSEKFKTFSPKSYNSVAEWKVNYNHTHGIGIDLYESFLQKIYEDKPGTSMAPFIWNLDEIADYFSWSFSGVVRKIAKKAPKAQIKAYAAGVAKKLAKKR